MARYFKYLFSFAILLLFLLGGISTWFLSSVSNSFQQLHTTPYHISDRLKNFKLYVQEMHLAVMKNDVDLIASSHIDVENRATLKIISKQDYLPNTEVKALQQQYENWVMASIYAPSDSVADELGQQYSQLLKTTTQISGMVEEYLQKSQKKAQQQASDYITYNSLLIALAVLASIFLLLNTLRSLHKMNANRLQYLYLIDQNVMIAAIDESGSIFEISNHLCRFLSQSKEDLLSRQVRNVFFDDQDDLYDEMWQDINTGLSWYGELPINSDGQAKWLAVDVLPMQTTDYKYSGFRLLARDITSRKSLEEISITDSLTGLLNRRTLGDTLDRATALSFRNKSPLIVGILDIDYFKQYNDNYGHVAGDHVLVTIACTLNNMLERPDDFAFRMGGEEFLFMFNSSDVEQSKAYVEKIRLAIRELEIEHRYSKIDDCVTISIGAIFFDGHHVAEASHLITDADENLYKAKQYRNHSVQTVFGAVKSGGKNLTC